MTHSSLTRKIITGSHGAVASSIVVAMVVAFAYWCVEVEKAEKAGAVGSDGNTTFLVISGTDIPKGVNANRRRDEAFQGAVVGVLMLFALKHIREDFGEFGLKKFIGPHKIVAFSIAIAMVIAFSYWCVQVKDAEDAGAVGSNATAWPAGTESAKSINANRRMIEAFQGAILGFSILFAINHLRKDF